MGYNGGALSRSEVLRGRGPDLCKKEPKNGRRTIQLIHCFSIAGRRGRCQENPSLTKNYLLYLRQRVGRRLPIMANPGGCSMQNARPLIGLASLRSWSSLTKLGQRMLLPWLSLSLNRLLTIT